MLDLVLLVHVDHPLATLDVDRKGFSNGVIRGVLSTDRLSFKLNKRIDLNSVSDIPTDTETHQIHPVVPTVQYTVML